MIQKGWVVVFCLLLIGCVSQQSIPETPTTAVVYEIYPEPEVEMSLGRILHPISREGLEIILENTGEISAEVYLTLETSHVKDEDNIFCKKTDDTPIPKLKQGQRFHYVFYLEGCLFPREDNIYQGMRLTFEVHDKKTGKVLDTLTRVMQDGIRNDRNPVY